MIDQIVVGSGNARIAVPMTRDRTQRHLAAAIIKRHFGLTQQPSR